MVYQVERNSDGAMSVEPIALFSKLIEAKNYISQLIRKGKEAYGISITPFRASRI
jgi:hypothetical protein